MKILLLGLLTLSATSTFAAQKGVCNLTPSNIDSAVFGYYGKKVSLEVASASDCTEEALKLLGTSFESGTNNARVLSTQKVKYTYKTLQNEYVEGTVFDAAHSGQRRGLLQ